jgi:phage baseplate assembly protein W
MLPLSANPDFQNLGEQRIPNPYYDINGDKISKHVEVYGSEALDQAIEAILCTEPRERIFNLAFSSPLYSLLFENHTQMEGLMATVFDQIEYWVPITIFRDKAEVVISSSEHSVSFQIPYISNDGKIAHIFNRVISK